MVEIALADLVRAASGVLLVLLGLAFVALGRGREPRVLGVFLAALGSGFVLFNLTRGDLGLRAGVALLTPPGYVTVLATGIWLAFRWPTPLRGRERGLALLALALGVASELPLAVTEAVLPLAQFPDGWLAHPSEAGRQQLLSNHLQNVGILAAALTWSFRAAALPRDGAARRLLAAGTLGVGLYAVVQGASYAERTQAALYGPLAIVLVVSVPLAAGAAWLAAARGPDAALARRVGLALFAAGVGGVAAAAWIGPGSANPDVGIARTLGWAALAWAALRHGLLGRDLGALAARRGSLATGGIAVLFIVAQVAQNYFAEAYGLLVGGVVAGAFLFAAHPVQRAFEARGPRSPAPAPAAPAPAAGAQEAFRKALRLALHDGALTREEERLLADLATDLGVTYRDAVRLRDEVARELGREGA